MTNKEAVGFVQEAARSSDKNYVLNKASEEFQELALVLTQQVNKPDKDYTKDIHEEAGHALLRLTQLIELFDEGAIEKSFIDKAAYLKRGKEQKKWKNL